MCYFYPKRVDELSLNLKQSKIKTVSGTDEINDKSMTIINTTWRDNVCRLNKFQSSSKTFCILVQNFPTASHFIYPCARLFGKENHKGWKEAPSRFQMMAKSYLEHCICVWSAWYQKWPTMILGVTRDCHIWNIWKERHTECHTWANLYCVLPHLTAWEKGWAGQKASPIL